MFRWPHLAGIGLGLITGACLLGLSGGARHFPPSGTIVSECDGALREIVVHYEPSAKQVSLPVYREFFSALEQGVTVKVVCPEYGAFHDLRSLVGDLRCRLEPVVVHHPITTWSRDRWVALTPEKPSGVTTLLTPRGEAAEDVWPARAGDKRVATDLAIAAKGAVSARRSVLHFDGGDFLSDQDTVFVMPRVISRNLQRTVVDRADLVRVLSAELKKRVVLLKEAPDHHAGMFMASAGNGRMLVGDPRLGRALLSEKGFPLESLPGFAQGADLTAETQRLFDAVARQCESEGYKVWRVPTVVAPDGRTYLTYVNAVLDKRAGKQVVYMPVYDRMEEMNIAAQRVWESLGCEVRRINCTSVYAQFGCLHCLVNVVKRDPLREDVNSSEGLARRSR